MLSFLFASQEIWLLFVDNEKSIRRIKRPIAFSFLESTQIYKKIISNRFIW